MAEQSDVCNFFSKPSQNRAHIRKRKRKTTTTSSGSESDPEPDPDQPKPTTKKILAPGAAGNKLLFTSSSSKPAASSSRSDEPEHEPQPEPGRLFHFESSREIQTRDDARATAILETETDFSRDARAIREWVLKQAEEALKGKSKPESDKLYKGIHGYTDYKAGFRREHTVAGEKAGGSHGPLRASAHIRTSARFDYQPDICKDYKETGYCGFGDACKFMHDRGDYKSGWQMEKEWEEKEKARKRAMAMGGGDDGEGDGGDDNDDDNEDDENALPFACFLCRRPFEDPVVTKCKHYFCEHCALRHHAKNKKCFVCNKPTLGIFNTAHEIRKKMAQEKQ